MSFGSEKFSESERKKIAENVLAYYKHHQRSLPWRDNPIPYYVWISEIMLQQTRVETVIDYFNRFTKVFPTVEDLAEADEELLLKQWEGLGYYSRARNLQKAAKMIVQDWDGKLPDEKTDLLTLAGVGDYTAGAIASIAYGKKEVAVDGNFIRVACRLLATSENVWNASGKRMIEDFWKNVLPDTETGAFNQGIMDIGATICLPNGEPHCVKCPISDNCQSFAQGNPMDYPMKKPKKKRKIEKKTVLLLYRYGKVLIRKRPEKGLLAGLFEFPMIEGHAGRESVEEWLKNRGYGAIKIKKGKSAKHIFSHIEWKMNSWEVEIEAFSVKEKANSANESGVFKSEKIEDVLDDVILDKDKDKNKNKNRENLVAEEAGEYLENENEVGYENEERWISREDMDVITLPTAFKVFRERVFQHSL